LISNFKPLIEQQQFFFDFLWDKANQAYQKNNELEGYINRENTI